MFFGPLFWPWKNSTSSSHTNLKHSNSSSLSGRKYSVSPRTDEISIYINLGPVDDERMSFFNEQIFEK